MPELGCGCYVPFLAQTPGACWARERRLELDGRALGWE